MLPLTPRGYNRRAQDSNLQIISDRLFSKQLPQPPGHTAYIVLKGVGEIRTHETTVLQTEGLNHLPTTPYFTNKNPKDFVTQTPLTGFEPAYPFKAGSFQDYCSTTERQRHIKLSKLYFIITIRSSIFTSITCANITRLSIAGKDFPFIHLYTG